MATVAAGGIIKSGDTIEVDGDYFIDPVNGYSLTMQDDFGGGTIKIHPGTQKLSATTATASGTESAGYTDDFNIYLQGPMKINLSGSTSPNIEVIIDTVYTRIR